MHYKNNPDGYSPTKNPIGSIPAYNRSPEGTYVQKILLFRREKLITVTRRKAWGEKSVKVYPLTRKLAGHFKARLTVECRIVVIPKWW